MKDKRTFKCMASCKGRVEFDMHLKEKQICVCNKCGNQHRVRPFKNGRVNAYNLQTRELGVK